MITLRTAVRDNPILLVDDEEDIRDVLRLALIFDSRRMDKSSALNAQSPGLHLYSHNPCI